MLGGADGSSVLYDGDPDGIPGLRSHAHPHHHLHEQADAATGGLLDI